jgi:DnaJ-class molecular chaperone
MDDTATKCETCRRCSGMGFLMFGKNSRTCGNCKGKGRLNVEARASLKRIFSGATRPLPRRFGI